MKRQLRLMQKTVEELFELYSDEYMRASYEDKKTAQDAIRHELKCRTEQMLRLLETEDNVNVKKAYKCTFLQPALKSRDDTAWE